MHGFTSNGEGEWLQARQNQPRHACNDATRLFDCLTQTHVQAHLKRKTVTTLVQRGGSCVTEILIPAGRGYLHSPRCPVCGTGCGNKDYRLPAHVVHTQFAKQQGGRFIKKPECKQLRDAPCQHYGHLSTVTPQGTVMCAGTCFLLLQSAIRGAYTWITCSSIAKTSSCWSSCTRKIIMLLSLSAPSFGSQDRAPAPASTHSLSKKLSEKAVIAFSNAAWNCCPTLYMSTLPTTRYNTLVVALRRAEGACGPFPTICAAAASLSAR